MRKKIRNFLVRMKEKYMDKKYIHSSEDLDDFIERNLKGMPEEKIIEELTRVFLKLPREQAFRMDPFSGEYLEEVRKMLYRLIRQKEYSPEINEKAPFLKSGSEDFRKLIAPYNYTHSDFVGELLAAYALVVKALDVKTGDSILEYGAGTGGISIPLARMGCEVSVIDIDENYLEIIRKQCEWYQVGIRTRQGVFGENIHDGDKYDRILFYEAFHHSLDHYEVLKKLNGMLKEGGMVYFAGEPVIPDNSYFSEAVPYMWGPRLDGLSLRAMRDCGWCELGFREGYFIHLLLKSGYTVTRKDCPQNHRASCYIACENKGRIEVAKGHLIGYASHEPLYHEPEAGFIWTYPECVFAVDKNHPWKEISFEFYNPLPVKRVIRIVSDRQQLFEIPPGARRIFRTPLSEGTGDIALTCDPVVPKKLIPGSKDTRSLGIAIEAVSYYPAG